MGNFLIAFLFDESRHEIDGDKTQDCGRRWWVSQARVDGVRTITRGTLVSRQTLFFTRWINRGRAHLLHSTSLRWLPQGGGAGNITTGYTICIRHVEIVSYATEVRIIVGIVPYETKVRIMNH